MNTFIKIVSDTISYSISVYLSMLLYSEPIAFSIREINFYLIFGGYFFFLISIVNYKGYESFVEFSKIREITALINAAILMLVVSIIILFTFGITMPSFITISSRIVFCLSLLIVPILCRIIFNSIFPTKIRNERSLLIGAGEIGRSFIKVVKKSDRTRFKIIGLIDDNINEAQQFEGISILGGINNLDKICEKNKIDRIIVAVRHLAQDKIDILDAFSIRNKIPLNFLPSIESFQNNPGKLKEHAGIPLISNRFKKQTLFYSIGKRVFDIVISLIGLIISTPFWLILPILIKKDSEGPIIFKQERVGIYNKIFCLFKFRSMYIDSPKYAHCPSDGNDPRITKIGSWLRKTSIDELPQLINVLRGDMSLVGPRPEMQFIVNDYNAIEKKRLLIKPGLTGLWQISPYRKSEISHNLEYDFYYIENQGYVLDIVILILTIFFAIRGFTN